MLLGFPDYDAAARRLAEAAQLPYACVDVHHFPDGESKLRLPSDLPARVILCRSLHRPNDKLVELTLAAVAARDAGVHHLTLVAPYLCYMRQDIAFVPGEAVSQRIIGAWLDELFDTLVTVDPHLHRIHDLREVMRSARTVTLSAGALMGEFLQHRLDHPLLVGPDSESRQWVARIAKHAGLDFIVGEKQRLSDHDVRIALPQSDVRGRIAVIVDDIASTGRTLAEAGRALRGAGAAAVHCCVSHALFVADAETRMREAGIDYIYSSDSVPHASNRIALCELLAGALAE